MDEVQAAEASRRYESRPGRNAVVAADLADLRGPTHGRVELPLRLYWSPPGRIFDLDDPAMLRSMYEFVLGEAISLDELSSYLNGNRLAVVWPELYLPKGVRRAWEDRHAVLRTGRAA